VYKISTDQDASYVRELAEYINEKMELLHRQSAYSKQANAFRQIILLMNMADDYCRMKQQAEEATRKYEQQEAEFYNMKREMVNMQMTIASLKKQLRLYLIPPDRRQTYLQLSLKLRGLPCQVQGDLPQEDQVHTLQLLL
jgi:protein subunit release factor A